MVFQVFVHQTLISISGVTFYFSEASQSVEEGSNPGMLVAPFSKSPMNRLANPVLLQVTPMTITEARRRSIAIPAEVEEENHIYSFRDASKIAFLYLFDGIQIYLSNTGISS